MSQWACHIRRPLPAMVAAALLLCCCYSIAGAKDAVNEGDQTKIIALENIWNLATVHKDMKVLDQLMDDNFVATDWNNTFNNKVQFLQGIKDAAYRPQQLTDESISVHLHANAAVVTGIYREKGFDGGKPYDHRARFTDTWLFEDGEWRCIASHASFLEKRQH